MAEMKNPDRLLDRLSVVTLHVIQKFVWANGKVFALGKETGFLKSTGQTIEHAVLQLGCDG